MSISFGTLDVGGLGELLFYDKCFTKRWDFWLKHEHEVKYHLESLINQEFNSEIQEGDSLHFQKLETLRKKIPKINFLNQPNKRVMKMVYSCLKIIDDLSEVKSKQEIEEREYQRLYILCEYISLHTGLIEDSNLIQNMNQEVLINLSETFTISDFLRYPYDYLGEIYEGLIGSSRKNINLRPINTTSHYGLIFSQSIFEFPLIIDQNVETGRRLLTLSNDYFVFLGYSCSIIGTIITQVNLHIYAPWTLSFKEIFEPIDMDQLNDFTKEAIKPENLEFSYRFPDEESYIKEDYESYIDYLLINRYKMNPYLSLYYDSFPIFFKTKTKEDTYNYTPEIQYFPKLLSLIYQT